MKLNKMADTQSNSNQTKKSTVKVIGGGFSKWFGMLTGRGASQSNPIQVQNSQPVDKKNQPLEEDSVAEDIKKAKKLLSLGMQKFSKSAGPSVQKGKEMESKGVEYAKKVVDVDFTKKAVKIFLVIIFVLIILFVASRVLDLTNKNGGDTNVPTPTNVPTAPPYKRTEPSIYDKDATILKIEEDAKVLLNEIVGKSLDDDSISPPNLDVNINFER